MPNAARKMMIALNLTDVKLIDGPTLICGNPPAGEN